MKQTATKKHYNKETGSLGEQIAANYLQKRGFTILEMNYAQRWGEIDVVAKKDDKIHFVEVKTVSYGTKQELDQAVAHGTWRPEENVHAYKVKKLSRAIETWLGQYRWKGDWQIDVVGVRIVPRETYATVKYIDNIIL